MSFIGNLFSSSGGAGYVPATTSPLLQTTDPNAVQNAQVGTNNALGQQQQFLNALQAQNGIGNQASTYNQLQGVANGTGPNPAAAMLNNATGQNVSNQAALMAGQRGASSNPALIARQAAQQGASAQQNAVGQGAALQANQSLGALGQMSGIAGQQVGQQASALGTLQQNQLANQGQQLGAAGQLNNTNLSQQQGINQIQGTQALSNQQFQQGVVGGLAQGVGGALGSFGGSLGSAGGGAAAAAGATGGKVGKNKIGSNPKISYDAGGMVSSPIMDTPQSITNDAAAGIGGNSSVQSPSAPSIDPNQPQSRVGQQLQATSYTAGSQVGSGIASALGGGSSSSSGSGSGGGGGGGMSSIMKLAPLALMALHKGGKVDALVSPGEKFLKPGEAKAVAAGKTSPQKVGEMIPGKASVPGDSLKNDTVPKKLEQGGVVIPRSVMQGGPEKARAFVAAVMARHPGKPRSDSKSSGFHKL